MTNEVVITVVGSQEDGDIVLTTCGSYYKKDDMHYVFYQEQADSDSDIVKDKLKFNDTTFEITKRGAINSQMNFKRDDVTCNYYQTPYGPIDIEITTKSYDFKESDSQIDLNVYYSLSLNKQEGVECHVSVKIEAKR